MIFTPAIWLLLTFAASVQAVEAPPLFPPSTDPAQLPSVEKCSPVHIIAARGSGEAPGEGTIGKLATQLKQKIPGSTSAALDYPARMPYSGSIPVGVTNLKKAIAAYTSSCPNGKLVLIGYSQGGAVTVDTLCGGGGKDVGPATPGLTPEEGRLIKIAVSYGDPRFVPGVSYALGTHKGPKGGVSTRTQTLPMTLLLTSPRFRAVMTKLPNVQPGLPKSGRTAMPMTLDVQVDLH
jgi:hypothetical protein